MTNKEPTVFGKKLKELRESFGDSTVEFAKRAQIEIAYVNYYEKSPWANPTISIIEKIAKNCGVSADWLCGRIPEGSSMNRDIQSGIKLAKMTHDLDALLEKIASLEKKNAALEETVKAFESNMDHEKKEASKRFLSLEKEIDVAKTASKQAVEDVAVLKEVKTSVSIEKVMNYIDEKLPEMIAVSGMKKAEKSKGRITYDYRVERMLGEHEGDVYVPKFLKNESYNPSIKEFGERGGMPTQMVNKLYVFGLYRLKQAARLADSDLQKIKGFGEKSRDDFKSIIKRVYGIDVPNCHLSWKDDVIDTRIVDYRVLKFLRNRECLTYRDLQDFVLNHHKEFNAEPDVVKNWIRRYLDDDVKHSLDHDVEITDRDYD